MHTYVLYHTPYLALIRSKQYAPMLASQLDSISKTIEQKAGYHEISKYDQFTNKFDCDQLIINNR